MTTTCDEMRDLGVIERYVAGTASDDEVARLESHYLTCARCQADVRLAAAIRATPAQSTRRWRWIPAGVLAAAALVAVVVLTRQGPDAALTRLGAVIEPPVYLGVPVRGTPAKADSLFAAAMRDYLGRRYEQAATGLGAALAAGVDSAPAEFFRAASLLAANKEGAHAGFQRVIALGETPYLAESHYYLAKLFLRMSQANDALAQLKLVGSDNPDLVTQASALADSVRAVAR